MQDIIMSNPTDELDFLDLAAALSQLTLKDPPIYRVPHDILYILFRLVCAGPPSLDTLKQALALTHVCGSWRAIAIRAPHLWTYFRMSSGSTSSSLKVRNHSLVVDSLLRRSARLPFEFHLVGGLSVDRAWTSGSGVAPRFERAFRSRSVRCEKLRIAIPPNRYLDELLDAVKGMRMGVLKRVEFDILASEQLVVELDRRDEVGTSTLRVPDDGVRMFGWNALRPGFGLPKYQSLLGWLSTSYHITSLSIKYLPGITPVLLHPALLASKDTLAYLALYNHQPPLDELEIQLEPVCLPKLERLDIGYMQPSILLGFVKLLLLPGLKHLSVRDFGGCPETVGRRTPTHFGGVGQLLNTNSSKDAYHLLVGLVTSIIATQPRTRALIKLDMYGVMCRTTTRLLVLEPLRDLVLGLQSLAMVDCDGRFPQLLKFITTGCRPDHLKSLKELVMTGHPVHTMLLDYLRTRKSVDLPKLKSLGVCSRMAAFRHFFEEFVETSPVVVGS